MWQAREARPKIFCFLKLQKSRYALTSRYSYLLLGSLAQFFFDDGRPFLPGY